MQSFKEYITQEIPAENINTQLSNYVYTTLMFSLQTHVYHVQTKSNAEHIALKEFYDSIRNSADSIMEKVIALKGNLAPTTTPLVTFNYDKGFLLQQLDTYRTLTTSIIGLTNVPELISLNDVIINIQDAIDTLVYKLELK